MQSLGQQKNIEKQRLWLSGKLFILFIVFIANSDILGAQDSIRHAAPIYSAEPDTATFYDRLEKVLHNGKITRVNGDSSFSWLDKNIQ